MVQLLVDVGVSPYVLATLLGYVASSGDPVTGGALLLTYTSGYVAPLLAAATMTGSLQRIMSARAYTAWVTPASGKRLYDGKTKSIYIVVLLRSFVITFFSFLFFFST